MIGNVLEFMLLNRWLAAHRWYARLITAAVIILVPVPFEIIAYMLGGAIAQTVVRCSIMSMMLSIYMQMYETPVRKSGQ